jgi:hypothetical protein
VQQQAYAESEALRQALNDDNPRMVAIHLANCLRDRVWEAGIAQRPGHPTGGKPRIYATAMDWMREELKRNPDEIMRRLTGAHPRIDDATAAAKALITAVATEDMDAFRSFMGDCADGDDNLPGWRKLLKGQADMLNGLWAETAAMAEEFTIKPRGNPTGANQHSEAEGGIPHTMGDSSDGRRNYQPTDARGRAIRTFLNLKKNPEACAAKGTTPERVEAAYSRLIRGLTTVEGAKREAGIDKKRDRAPGWGIRLSGSAESVAPRVIEEIGAAAAAALAKAILSLTEDT